MKRYLELGLGFQHHFPTLALVLSIDYRKLKGDESLLWVSANIQGSDEVGKVTSDLPDW